MSDKRPLTCCHRAEVMAAFDSLFEDTTEEDLARLDPNVAATIRELAGITGEGIQEIIEHLIALGYDFGVRIPAGGSRKDGEDQDDVRAQAAQQGRRYAD